MLQFLMDLAQFALQTAIIVAGLLIIIGFTVAMISKGKDTSELKVKSVNKKLAKHRSALQKKLLEKKELKQLLKSEKQKAKKDSTKGTIFVLNFDGDIKASAVDHLRQEVSAILMVAKPTDKVLLKLESPGGMVHGYGLAASQLQRIKDKNLELIVCVDKVAASGGYMMASLGSKIISAPFAIIGSIGVVASLPNFNKVLKKYDVDYLEITAGEYKRTLTPLGEITEPGMKKFKEQIEDVHDLFKNHVKKFRPQAEIDKVATGEYWYGQQALDLKLIDEMGTSDQYLLDHEADYKVIEVSFEGKKSLKEKLSEGIALAIEGLVDRFISKAWRARFQ